MAKANTMGAVNEDPIARRLQGRIDWLLKFGRVQDPELMQSALEVMTDLADAAQGLLDCLYELSDPDDPTEALCVARIQCAIARING